MLAIPSSLYLYNSNINFVIFSHVTLRVTNISGESMEKYIPTPVFTWSTNYL